MWTVVYMAQNKETADKLLEILQNEGLLAKVRPIIGEEGCGSCYEVLVPESEVEEAHSIIIEKGF